MDARACSRMLFLTSLLTLSACRLGARPEDIPATTTAAGGNVRVTYLRSGVQVTDAGESIEVRDDGLLARLSGGYTLIRFSAVVEARFLAIGGDRRIERPGGRGALDELAQVSRYPFGLSDEQLARLLASANQTALIEVVP